jgi:hypothetical protein
MSTSKFVPTPTRTPAPALPAGRYAGLLRRDLHGRRSKLLVTGMRGCGASAVASVLQQIGFFLGPDLDPLTLESASMRRLLQDGELGAAQAMLEAWAEGHPRLACKGSELFSPQGAELVHALPSEWLVLAVCRDPAALAQRSLLSGGTDLAQALKGFAHQQDQLIRFAISTNKSVLFVSYERLMLTPEIALAEILVHTETEAGPQPAFDAIWETLLRQRNSYRQLAGMPPETLGESTP